MSRYWATYCRASKSRENTATKGWKRTGTFLLTFTFADKHSGCYGHGLIDVAEKFEFGGCSIWIVEDVGRGSFLFPTYLGRLKETAVRRVTNGRKMEKTSRQTHCPVSKILQRYIKELKLTVTEYTFSLTWRICFYFLGKPLLCVMFSCANKNFLFDAC